MPTAEQYADELRSQARTTQKPPADLDAYWDGVAQQANPIRQGTVPGELVSAKMAKQNKSVAEKAGDAWSYFKRKMVDSGEAVTRVGNAVGDAQHKVLAAASGNLSRRGYNNVERAKEGASDAGKVALDVIGQGVQMAGDLAIAGITGGSALIPMTARTFGSGTMEAEQAGADIHHAALYGAATSAVEVLTEKMFDGLAGIYGKGAADELVAGTINRLTTNQAARGLLNIAASAVGESMEEFASSIVNPALKSIYNGKRLGQNYSELEASEILYDMLIGGLMGAIGGTANVAGYNPIAQANQGAAAQKTAVSNETTGRALHRAEMPTREAPAAIAYENGTERVIPQAQKSIANSPTRIRIKADADIEAENISRGEAAINQLFKEAETAANPENLTVEGAMYRSDLGPIDFKWGKPGIGERFRHGFGLAHLFARRNAEGESGKEIAKKMAEVIAKATDVDIQGSNDGKSEVYNVRLYYDGHTAVLVKNPGSNHWLLTGWKNKTATSATGEGYDSSGATAATPTPTRRDGGNATVYKNIPQQSNPVKPLPSTGYAALLKELAEEKSPKLTSEQRRELKKWNDDNPDMYMSDDEFLSR